MNDRMEGDILAAGHRENAKVLKTGQCVQGVVGDLAQATQIQALHIVAMLSNGEDCL
jgi:hypothetical protein